MTEITEEEKRNVAGNMKKYGGSFVSYLGETIERADAENTRKIKNTWPDLWEKYKNFGDKNEP